MHKPFPLITVLEWTTGFCMTNPNRIQELFNHIYPAVPTTGMIIDWVHESMTRRILEQHPSLPTSIPDVFTQDAEGKALKGQAFIDAIQPWLREQEALFGLGLMIEHDPLRAEPKP